MKIYVKSKEKGKLYKRKTRSVQPNCYGVLQFKQTVKYDASLLDNKTLEISVWQRQGGLKSSKLGLGMTEIRLCDLNLTQTQKCWYNLKPIDIPLTSSVEE